MSNLPVQLLDNIHVAIAVVSDAGTISYRNRCFADGFGSEADEWMENNARAVGGERGWLQGFFLDSGRDHSIDIEYQGRVYHVERIPNTGNEKELALMFEDVTRQRETEQAKSDFTSMIVHDLRGPLSGIQGTLEFVLGQETARLDSLYEELLREASRESERMMGLINELLDFSKIESGNFEIGHDAVPISGLLKRSVHSLQSVAARDDIHLVSAHGIDLPMLTGSEEKLTQAVINLLSNALKFTPKKGVISIGAQVVRDQDGPKSVVVTVTDSGMGIRPDDLKQLFEKYKQTKNKSLRGGGGTGLGLYIVKQIVEAHGGAVNIASIEGIGTSMILSLPVRRTAA
ncbi:MAG TPA: PAS domain-containing sensor histidine kinase [Thermoanaerobaculia bacterium]|nr:PAS domain-containing sensor histidine kinase [Thermoanaerobaculia bacterium]